MPKKKKRSGNNLVRRAQRYAPVLLKDKAVVWASGIPGDYNLLMDIKRGRLVTPTTEMQWALADIPHPWAILIAVLCKGDDGTPYMKIEEYGSNVRYLQRDLVEFFNEKHHKLIKGANHKHVIGAAYIASPFGHSLEEEKAYQIFELIGAFDREITSNGEVVVVPAPIKRLV